jgi:hypothetical protein
MNQSEKKRLREVMHTVVRRDVNFWPALKRQIFDFGYELRINLNGHGPRHSRANKAAKD